MSDGTATFPLALWEREQLCEQSELTTAGEGLIRCKEAKRQRCEANLEDRKLRRYEGRPFTINSLQSVSVIVDSAADPQAQDSEMLKHGGQSDVLDDTNPLPQSLPRGRDVKSSSSRFTLHSSLKKRVAFTLAEVLITLGIIGVVAAMTMPTLINKTQNRQLQTAFKKAYSVQSQALLYTKQNLGIENLRAAFAVYDSNNKVYYMANQFYNEYYKYLQINDSCEYEKPVRNYSNTADAYIDVGTSQPNKQLPDGSCANVKINARTINITVDVNGAKKGPNRLGYDIFVFEVNDNDALVPKKTSKKYTDDELEDIKNQYDDQSLATSVPAQAGNPCSIESSQRGNGLGCSWYALNDINPDDETKGYWESLP